MVIPKFQILLDLQFGPFFSMDVITSVVNAGQCLAAKLKSFFLTSVFACPVESISLVPVISTPGTHPCCYCLSLGSSLDYISLLTNCFVYLLHCPPTNYLYSYHSCNLKVQISSPQVLASDLSGNLSVSIEKKV